MDEVSGSVDYDLNGQLPDGSKLVVELRDTSLRDAPSVLISRDDFEVNGSPPHNFRLQYNSRSVGEKNTYSLSARIETAAGDHLFVSDTPYDAITQGNPSRVDMDLVPTNLAESLVVAVEPTEVDNGDPEPIETVPVNSRPDPQTNQPDPAPESAGGGGLAFLIILVVVVGFVWVLIARHRETRTDDEQEEEDPTGE